MAQTLPTSGASGYENLRLVRQKDAFWVARFPLQAYRILQREVVDSMRIMLWRSIRAQLRSSFSMIVVIWVFDLVLTYRAYMDHNLLSTVL